MNKKFKLVLVILKYFIIRKIESLPLVTSFIINNIFFFRFLLPHEKDYLGILKLKLNPKLDIVDVGANVGSSFLSFRELGLKNKIHCFEPNKYLFKNKLRPLKKKFKDLFLYSVALGNSNNAKNFYVPYFKGQALNYFGGFDKNYVINSCNITFSKNTIKKIVIKKHIFKLKKLDSYDNINPCFIKIDSEGYDFKVILGSINIIKKYKPIFLIEYNATLIKKISKVLKAYNIFYYNFRDDKFYNFISNPHKNIAARKDDKNYYSCRNLYFIHKKVKVSNEN